MSRYYQFWLGLLILSLVSIPGLLKPINSEILEFSDATLSSQIMLLAKICLLLSLLWINWVFGLMFLSQFHPKLRKYLPKLILSIFGLSCGLGISPANASPNLAPADFPDPNHPHEIHPAKYLVKQGDSLWKIASKYQDSNAEISKYWPRIYSANRSLIGADPNQIQISSELSLPETESK